MKGGVIVVNRFERRTFKFTLDLLVRAVGTLITEGFINRVDALTDLMKVLPMSEQGEPDWKNIVFIDAFRMFRKHCPKEKWLPVWDQISIDHYLGTVNGDDRIFVSPRIGVIIDQRKLDTFIVDPIEIELLLLKHPNAERIQFDGETVGLIVPRPDNSIDIKFATKSSNGEPSLWELKQ